MLNLFGSYCLLVSLPKIGKTKSYCQTFNTQQPCSQDCTRPIKKSCGQQQQTHESVVLTQEEDGGKLTQDLRYTKMKTSKRKCLPYDKKGSYMRYNRTVCMYAVTSVDIV